MGAEFFNGVGRMDRHKKLIVSFREFANAPKEPEDSSGVLHGDTVLLGQDAASRADRFPTLRGT
jgi:hypothetical protein